MQRRVIGQSQTSCLGQPIRCGHAGGLQRCFSLKCVDRFIGTTIRNHNYIFHRETTPLYFYLPIWKDGSFHQVAGGRKGVASIHELIQPQIGKQHGISGQARLGTDKVTNLNPLTPTTRPPAKGHHRAFKGKTRRAGKQNPASTPEQLQPQNSSNPRTALTSEQLSNPICKSSRSSSTGCPSNAAIGFRIIAVSLPVAPPKMQWQILCHRVMIDNAFRSASTAVGLTGS